MSKVSHSVVGPATELVRSGQLTITEFVQHLKNYGLIVVEVALSETPTLDYLTRPIAVKPYIVARVIHEEKPLADPVEYALQTPQPI